MKKLKVFQTSTLTILIDYHCMPQICHFQSDLMKRYLFSPRSPNSTFQVLMKGFGFIGERPRTIDTQVKVAPIE